MVAPPSRPAFFPVQMIGFKLNKKEMTEPREEFESDIEALFKELNEAYMSAQKTYKDFVKTIQDKEPREKAERWLEYVASNIETYGNQEALVYLRSRGHECNDEISELIDSWRRAAKREIEECSRGIGVHVLETGEMKHKGGIPLSEASNVRNVSSFLLPDFWSGRDEQQLSIDATMLRTVEWCDIGGFDEWWERLAQSLKREIFQGGIEPVQSSIQLFHMVRSDYAIQLMDAALVRALEAIELPFGDERYPWLVFRALGTESTREYSHVIHITYASSIVLSNMRLHSNRRNTELVNQAVETILKTQTEDGSWPFWEGFKQTSVEATAMCVHAVALNKPRGWERTVAKAREWLWSKQSREGCWIDKASPDSVYLTVLVLDAIDLSENKFEVTFGKRFSVEHRQSETKSPRRFRVALSFPGELRELVEPVAESLAQKLGRKSVFYDRFYEAELARPNLDTYLQTIYHDQTDLIGIFLCSDYADKEWCGLEWRAIRDLIKTRRDEDIIIIRTDSSTIPGILSIDGYIDAHDHTPDQLADLILSRLEM